MVTFFTPLNLKPWEKVEIYGEKCWLVADDQYSLTLYDEETGPAKTWVPALPNTLLFVEEFGGYMGMLENFVQSIRGEELPLVTGWDGYKALETAVAVQLSIRNQKRIVFPLDPESADIEYRSVNK